MPAELSFILKDSYSLKIWNPEIINGEKAKSLTGEHFFSVIYSVYKQIKSSDKVVSNTAKRILDKLLKDVVELTSDLKSLTEILNLKKSEHVFSVSFSENTNREIKFTPTSHSGVCKENSLYLKMFISFDKYISTLNEIRVMAVITDKEFYSQRRNVQDKIRRMMEGYNVVIKQFHAQRKQKNET